MDRGARRGEEAAAERRADARQVPRSRRGGRCRPVGRSAAGRMTLMKFDMTSMDGSAAGSLEISDAIFGLEPRADLIARMVRYQLAKRRAGDHKTLGRGEINRTG